MHGQDTRVEANIRGAGEEGVPNRGLCERGWHQVPPEVAESGEDVQELPDHLDGFEQPDAQEAAAVLRDDARHTQDNDKVRRRCRVHADGGSEQQHDGPGHVGRRWSVDRFGRGGGVGLHVRAEQRPLLRGRRCKFGPNVQADESQTAAR